MAGDGPRSGAMPSRMTDLGWLRSPLWDGGFSRLAGSLSTSGSPPRSAVQIGETQAAAWPWRSSSRSASLLHRHYVLLLVYGDRGSFEERPRAYIVALMVAFAVVASATLSGYLARREVMLRGARNLERVARHPAALRHFCAPTRREREAVSKRATPRGGTFGSSGPRFSSLCPSCSWSRGRSSSRARSPPGFLRWSAPG